MKTIYSLKEFREEVLKIAKTVNEDYATVEVSIDSYGVVNFKCYIHHHGLHEGKTMEESLEKLKQSISPIKKDIDVEIEMPELQTEFDGEPLK